MNNTFSVDICKGISSASIFSKLLQNHEALHAFNKLSETDLARYMDLLTEQGSFVSQLIKNPSLLRIIPKLDINEADSLVHLYELPRWFTKNLETNPMLLDALAKLWDMVDDRPDMISRVLKVLNHELVDAVNAGDAFTKGQLESKRWLISTLGSLDLYLGNVWIVCGWIGSLAWLMSRSEASLRYTVIRSFDIDPNCTILAEVLNKPELIDGWRFKATTCDAYELTYESHHIKTRRSDGSIERLIETPTTIINTSCEHLLNFKSWALGLPYDRLLVLQGSNHIDYDGHVAPYRSLDDFSEAAGLNKTLYSGSLELEEYTRYMLIGYK